MKKILGACSALALSAVLFNACSKSNSVNDTTTSSNNVSSEIRNMVSAAGFNPNAVKVYNEGYLIENDIYLTKEQLQEIASNEGTHLNVANVEHYRSTNLVQRLPRTLTVKLNISGTKFSDALDIALARYNNENLQLRFVKSTAATVDIPITSINEGPVDGSIVLGRANGFPSNGNPGAGFSLNVNAQAYGASNVTVNHLASVMAHEIGHCIGFRHTDFANRAFSCGGGFAPEISTAGSVYIPGTPNGFDQDPTSWMLACISYPSGNRPFNSNDKVALNYLY
jgi:hypothetical protein